MFYTEKVMSANSYWRHFWFSLKVLSKRTRISLANGDSSKRVLEGRNRTLGLPKG